MKIWKYLTASSALFALFGCSESSNVAGNSAETGSPELAGVLYLDSGKPAALARVQCVPFDFDALRDTLPGNFQTVANDSGAYELYSLPAGKYFLEAFDRDSGRMLLVQNIDVPDSGSVAVSDTLFPAGYVLVKMNDSILDGSEGYALATGTTVMRSVKVAGDRILVDSLPADSLEMRVLLNGGKNLIEFDVNIPSADTAFVQMPKDTLIFDFVAPLAWPADADTSAGTYASDIPIALRLDSSICDFEDFDGLNGRWEVFRLSSEGGKSKALPIYQSYFDIEAEEALFWVRVDSLNVADSLELVFNTGLSSGYAVDVFPTSRSYTAVYHFDDGLDSISDAAEKQGYVGSGKGLKKVDGVLGSGAYFDGESYMVVDGSAHSDSTRKSDLNYGFRRNTNFSLWVKFDDISSAQTILAKGESQYDLRFVPDSGFVAELFHEPETYVDSTSDTTGYKAVLAAGADLVKADQWIHVAFDGTGQMTLTINGEVQKVKYVKVPWTGTRSENNDFEVGRMNGSDGASQYFKGSVDELYMSASLRPVSWNIATYLNQRPGEVWPKLANR